MSKGSMRVDVTADDIESARLVGATGTQLVEAAIHTALDRAGVPRDGRAVKVTKETITIDMPPGYDMREIEFPE